LLPGLPPANSLPCAYLANFSGSAARSNGSKPASPATSPCKCFPPDPRKKEGSSGRFDPYLQHKDRGQAAHRSILIVSRHSFDHFERGAWRLLGREPFRLWLHKVWNLGYSVSFIDFQAFKLKSWQPSIRTKCYEVGLPYVLASRLLLPLAAQGDAALHTCSTGVRGGCRSGVLHEWIQAQTPAKLWVPLRTSCVPSVDHPGLWRPVGSCSRRSVGSQAKLQSRRVDGWCGPKTPTPRRQVLALGTAVCLTVCSEIIEGSRSEIQLLAHKHISSPANTRMLLLCSPVDETSLIATKPAAHGRVVRVASNTCELRHQNGSQ